MDNLKHSMRQLFDKRHSTAANELEDGLLEKIVNLSVLNPSVFTFPELRILAVKSLNYKQKLYDLINKQRIFFDASVTLIMLENDILCSTGYYSSHAQLLSVSIAHAAKYYGVDCYAITDFDPDRLKNELKFESSKRAIMLVCLGYFDIPGTAVYRKHYNYSDVVREM